MVHLLVVISISFPGSAKKCGCFKKIKCVSRKHCNFAEHSRHILPLFYLYNLYYKAIFSRQIRSSSAYIYSSLLFSNSPLQETNQIFLCIYILLLFHFYAVLFTRLHFNVRICSFPPKPIQNPLQRFVPECVTRSRFLFSFFRRGI